MKVTLHQLHVFSVVAECASVTGASKILGLTQPAVSIHLKQLEKAFNISLFEVVGKQLYLTDAGKLLQSSSYDIQNLLKNLRMQFAEMTGYVKGSLEIMLASSAKYFMPHYMGEFQRLNPGIDVSLQIIDRKHIIQNLQKNIGDFAVLSLLPEDINLTIHDVMPNDMVLISAPNHSLANKKNVSFERLAHEPFLLREPLSGTRQLTEKLFAKYQLKPKVAMELSSTEALKQAVMAGIGLAVVPKISVQLELDLGRLVCLNVDHFPYRRHWRVVYPKGKKLSPVAKRFLTFLLEKHKIGVA